MTKKYISAIIFWGALWGLEEATLGHLLHVTALNIGWLLWFPLAYFFMSMVYRQTGKLNSILFTSMVAAAIKLVNFFMTINLVIVICPALSILLEGISLFTVLKLFDWKKKLYSHKLSGIAIISILWRILYTISILAIPVWVMPIYPYKTIAMLLKFILYQGIINSLLIYAAIMLARKISEINSEKNTYFRIFHEKIIKSKVFDGISFKPLISFSLLAITLIVQWVL